MVVSDNFSDQLSDQREIANTQTLIVDLFPNNYPKINKTFSPTTML